MKKVYLLRTKKLRTKQFEYLEKKLRTKQIEYLEKK